ncbi:MAG: acyltransferase [Clostridium sp.]|nr:acyltransferase [Clostridium sp.]
MHTTAPLPQKPRYELLDGLRGVAALMVIFYHFGEGFATSPVDQQINHGYLAVDFFFVLSGFVIGYAYDGRWKKGMTAGDFLLRRVIRLQPMVIVGVLLGVVSFAIQGCEKWDGTPVSTTAIILSLIFGLLMLPSLPGTLPDVRGYGEMFPLNGPSWSLFFEYIGSVFYALFLHRFSTRWLVAFTALSGLVLAAASIGNASGAFHIGFGWTAADYGFWLGLARMTFSFSVGLLMSRNFRPRRIRGAFWVCTALIVALLSVPYVGPGEPSVANGIYDAVCTLLLFPLIVYIGASGQTTDRRSGQICEFLGQISYPVYIVHYPFMYLFYFWLWNTHPDSSQTIPVMVAMVPAVILVAWLSLKYYDEPLRTRLAARLRRKN